MSDSPFDDVTIHWDGADHIIASDRVMGAIFRIEDHYSATALGSDYSSGHIRLGKLASAYASVLTYAGAKGVTTETVYAKMMSGKSVKNSTANIIGAVTNLLNLMTPPDRTAGEGETTTEKKRQKGSPEKPSNSPAGNGNSGDGD